MTNEQRNALYEAAPKLYSTKPSPEDRDLSPRQLARLYGPVYFAVCKGWFNLLMDLSVKLEAMEGIKDTHVVQVKEKFGGLRFYISHGTDEMFDAIDKAEETSYTICESCGDAGTLRREGWMQTLCDKHAKECYERL